MFKTLSSDTKKHKVSRNKNMFGSTYKKKTEPKFGGYFISYINTGYWGVFTNELSRKEKKKKEKNTKPRIIQIWCSREIIRNKKTREKKKWNKKKNSLKEKKIYKSLYPETQSVKKHKCQETQSVKKHNVSSNKKKNVWRYTKKTETKYGGQYILYIKIIEVFSQMSCL